MIVFLLLQCLLYLTAVRNGWNRPLSGNSNGGCFCAHFQNLLNRHALHKTCQKISGKCVTGCCRINRLHREDRLFITFSLLSLNSAVLTKSEHDLCLWKSVAHFFENLLRICQTRDLSALNLIEEKDADLVHVHFS